MYAIVEIGGRQFKAVPDEFIYVNRLDAAEGDTLEVEKVLLVDNNGVVKVGAPTVAGASVSATVLKHVRADKVIIFKKTRRKGFQKRTGHRQDLTKIKVESIKA